MNIGIFTECYRPTINGVVMSIDAFRAELEKRKHQVFIFCPNNIKAKVEANVFRVPSITLPSPKDYPVGIPYFSNLNQTISKLNLDLIHTQHIFLMGGFGQAMAKRLNIPTVHTYHTMMTEYVHYVPIKFLTGITKAIITARSRRFCNRANKVIVPSSPIIDVLASIGVKTPIEVLPTGINLNLYKNSKPADRKNLLKKYHIPAEKKILLFVGRLAQEKNLDFLLACFRNITLKYPKCHLVFVGSGPYDQKLKSEIKSLQLKNNITLTGFLDKSESTQFFGAADIFTFPSVTDTQGIVLAESMASGTPVVAINKLGPSDIVKNGQDGYLVPLKMDEFESKILKLLEDEDLRKKMAKRAEINAKRFSIQKCTDRLIKIYEETIKSYDPSYS